MADNTILSRLDGLKLKYEETGQKLTDPEVIASFIFRSNSSKRP